MAGTKRFRICLNIIIHIWHCVLVFNLAVLGGGGYIFNCYLGQLPSLTNLLSQNINVIE